MTEQAGGDLSLPENLSNNVHQWAYYVSQIPGPSLASVILGTFIYLHTNKGWHRKPFFGVTRLAVSRL